MQDVDYDEAFAPIPSAAAVKTFLAVAAQEDIQLFYSDTTQAFVQPGLDDTLCMKLPAGYGLMSGRTEKLDRALYGLKQVDRQWNTR